ncbi:C-type lectin LmsL [Callorhinchus milii]|uniref:C-type lectin LmsL-like n=2 Tax=Callorhinchus milii TaxID=7868 RepID=A0A4W3GXZ5_CALMI|nr:C-type lectin LmsL [Callorhinchus milii]|eukprot:gi/632961557/ref/XP_007896820.1/ PREDICTED: C-type lectin LmsL-like [Callorhinchus milii]
MLTVLILLSLLKSYSASDKPSETYGPDYGPYVEPSAYSQSVKVDYGPGSGYGFDNHAIFGGTMPIEGFPVEKYAVASNRVCKDRSGICKGPCQDGFFALNDVCYKYIHRKLCFADAELYCRHHFPGSHLASIHCRMNHMFIRNLIKASYPTCPKTWIGLTDCSKEGHFEWTDGTCSDHTAWCPSEPSDKFGKENCVVINHKSNYLWSDEDCAHEFNFICAYPLNCRKGDCSSQTCN